MANNMLNFYNGTNVTADSSTASTTGCLINYIKWDASYNYYLEYTCASPSSHSGANSLIQVTGAGFTNVGQYPVVVNGTMNCLMYGTASGGGLQLQIVSDSSGNFTGSYTYTQW